MESSQRHFEEDCNLVWMGQPHQMAPGEIFQKMHHLLRNQNTTFEVVLPTAVAMRVHIEELFHLSF